MVPHTSYSSWQLFRNGCQFRWKLDYLEGHRAENYGVHMDFGTACHETIELYRPRVRNPYVDVEVAVFFFREKFRWLYTNHREKYKAKEREIPVDFFLSAGERIIRQFDECDELREAEVVYNEHELLVDMDHDVRMKFKGFIDLVIKTKDKRGNTVLYVCDFKTCSWGWTREKKEDKELHFQILLYKHFLCKKFGLDPRLVRTAFVLLKKSPRKGDKPVEFFPISAGPVSVQRALDEMGADIAEMAAREKSGVFVKDRRQCHNAFGDTCPYFGHPLCPNDK